MNNPFSSEKSSQNRIYLKGVAVVVIALILLIPNAFIKDLIRERQNLQHQVTNEVSESWGRDQIITGPILKIPFETKTKHGDGKWYTKTDHYVIMPNALYIKNSLSTTTRQRSIYDVHLYTVDVKATGRFIYPQEMLVEEENKTILWEEAEIVVGVTDVTALQGAPTFTINRQEMKIATGAKLYDHIHSGFSLKNLGIDKSNKQFDFGFSCKVNGSRTFTINPVAQRTSIETTSDWPSPSFYGSFLPQQHDITDAGFSAQWEISEFNRNFPNFWINDKHRIGQHMAAIKMVDPLNDYHKNMRTAKYAILIIGLSFLLFFFIELLSGMRIHPIQYVLVGIALTIFYTLLISFTEHVGFDTAYFISVFATIGLIGTYCFSIIKKKKQAVFMMMILASLYTYIYIILQLEDFALLVGSIGLFAILAAVMLYTRKVNFYQLGNPD